MLGAALAYLVLLRLDGRVDIVWNPAPLWLPIVALATLAFLVRDVPRGVALLWALGLLSFVWSLAPGDTLQASLWGSAYVVLAAASRRRELLLTVMAFIVLQDLQNALAPNSFDLQRCLSRSVHYLLGAKALVVFSPAMVGFVRSAGVG